MNLLFLKKMVFRLMMPALGLAFVSSYVAAQTSAKKVVVEAQDTFPVPNTGAHQLFYLQRTSNLNTIICELNFLKNGQLNTENPVHVFWLRYENEGGAKKELNYLQRTFAYGINATDIGNGNYQLHFVSYKKQTLYLMKGHKDNQYHVYTNINQQQAILKRIFVKIEGGTFWHPNVVYMELKGHEANSGKEVMERFKPS